MPSKVKPSDDMASNTEDRPVFDFSNHSYADYLAAQKLEEEARKMILAGNANMAALEEITQERFNAWMKIVVSVPRSYLIADAPDGLNWADLDTYKWLKFDGVRKIIMAYNDAINGTKN